MIPFYRYFSLICALSWPLSSIADSQFKLSGYLKLDTLYDLGQKSGDRINYTAIKTTDSEINHGQARIHARESRIRFMWQEPAENIKAVIEIDFYGGGTNSPANSELISNSVSPRLRLAYLEHKNWRLGQDWSNYVDVKSFPENLDFANDTGQAFLRQGQIRYSYKWQSWHISHALENPESDIYQPPKPKDPDIAYLEVTRLDPLWDLTHKAKYQSDWGHISFQTAIRLLKASNSTIAGDEKTDNGSDNQWAYAIGTSGRIHLSDNNQFRFHFSQGKGIGRYIQEAANFAAYTTLSSPRELELLETYGGYIGFQHKWSQHFRSNLNAGFVTIDWPQPVISDLDGNTTKAYQSLHSNLIWSVSKKLQLGLEYSLARREDIAERQGFVRRLQASAKYTF